MYTGDWLKDPALAKCSAATRGIWIDIICAMHENGRTGRLAGTVAQLAQIARTTVQEICKAIEELKGTKTATVTVRNQKITLVNRRMVREFHSSQLHQNRQDRYRTRSAEKASAKTEKSDASVTPSVTPKKRSRYGPSSSSSSSSTSVEENSPPTPSLSPDPEWEQLVETSAAAGLRASPAELDRLHGGTWQPLPAEQKQAALNGIAKRVESGEYADPAWVPTLGTYLRETRWDRPLRPKPRPSESTALSRAGPTSKREQGVADFRRRLHREMEEKQENAGLVHRTGSG